MEAISKALTWYRMYTNGSSTYGRVMECTWGEGRCYEVGTGDTSTWPQ